MKSLNLQAHWLALVAQNLQIGHLFLSVGRMFYYYPSNYDHLADLYPSERTQERSLAANGYFKILWQHAEYFYSLTILIKT